MTQQRPPGYAKMGGSVIFGDKETAEHFLKHYPTGCRVVEQQRG